MAEWKMFRRVMFSHVKSADSDDTNIEETDMHVYELRITCCNCKC